MRIAHLVDPYSLELLYRFRYRIYVDELGWLPSNERETLTDEFDAHSFNYAAFDKEDCVVGFVRVTPDGPLGLPLEHANPLRDFRDGKQLAEISRLAVRADLRGSRLGCLLMKTAYQCCVRIGASHIVLDTYIGKDSSMQLYEKMGFKRVGDVYADNYYLCSLPVMTLAADITQWLRESRSQRPQLYRFFTAAN